MTMPTWVEPVTLDKWQTRPLQDDGVRCALAIHDAWAEKPVIRTTDHEIEHHYTGRTDGENLLINLMPDADPDADIAEWANALVRIVGFPVVALKQQQEAKLLRWEAVEAPSELAKRLDVDEVRLFEGMARLPDLIRIYMLLARRATTAWKVTLTIDSACPPGTVVEIVERNDHVRGGATFGALRFLP